MTETTIKRASHSQQIKDHLNRGYSLTGLDAFKLFECLHLAQRIKELRDRGLKIESEMIEIRGNKVASYSLEKEEKNV